jgi:hypothetical protein
MNDGLPPYLTTEFVTCTSKKPSHNHEATRNQTKITDGAWQGVNLLTLIDGAWQRFNLLTQVPG